MRYSKYESEPLPHVYLTDANVNGCPSIMRGRGGKREEEGTYYIVPQRTSGRHVHLLRWQTRPDCFLEGFK